MLALLLVLAGCAELLRSPPPPPPAGLLDGVAEAAPLADPTRSAVAAAAIAFDEGGRHLLGRPAETAQAAALLEFIAADLPENRRYAALPPTVWRELALARQEVRHALGIRDAAAPRDVQTALLSAGRALRAAHPAEAAAALPPTLFDPAGAAVLARLNELGPVPQASLATGWAQEAMARAEADGRIGGSQPAEGLPTGTTVTGPRQGMGVGY